MNTLTEHTLVKQTKLYLIFTIVILALGLIFSTLKFIEFRQHKTAIRALTSDIAASEALKNEVEQETKKTESAFQETQSLLQKHLQETFPADERYTDITRMLDIFFLEHHRPKNPVIASDLRFGTVATVEGASYRVLPFSLTLASSEENFFAFLDFVQKSGDLGSHVRLMDIESIKINFRNADGEATEQKETSGEEINVNIDLKAYLRGENPA